MSTLYSSYISIADKNYNILNLNIDELQILIKAFEYGRSSFFISGKKFFLTYVDEIKIFAHSVMINADDYISSSDSIDDLGPSYIKPSRLNLIGKDVTNQFIKGDFGSKRASEESVKYGGKEIDIFISHSSEDIKIAEALITLIKKSTNIENSKIRCTSVEGFKLPVGSSTEEQLRQEIFFSKIFIALITENSIKSTFVLFELGARWSTKEPLLPIICHPDGTSLLKGPLININALNATNPSDLLQFIEEIGKHLNIHTESAGSYLKEVEKLKELSLYKKTTLHEINVSTIDTSTTDLIIKSQAKILWPDDYEMQLDHIKRQRNAAEALKNGKPEDLSEDDFFKIRERAKQAWPEDFEMRLDQEKRQIQSLRKLKNI